MPPDRLPPISAALILETVGLEVFRTKFGMRQCLENGIGPRRKMLGPAPTTPIHFVPPMAAEAHDMTHAEAMEIARDEARIVLQGICELCPFQHCKMKAWGNG